MSENAYEMTAGMHEGMDELERAGQFWANARSRVMALAQTNRLQVTIEEHDDRFLFDLYDNGDYIPTDDEIVEAIKEADVE